MNAVKKLENNIPVLMEKIDDVKSFTMGIFVKTGSRNELENEHGISHYIEHMLFKGTNTKNAQELSEIIDYNGGSMNAFTSKDLTCYYVKMLSSKIDVAIEIFSDMFMNSTFTEENLDKERNVILEEIKMYEDIPEETIHDENIKFVLHGEYGNTVLGEEKTLKNINREIFMNYFDQKYIPENFGISIAGNFDFDKVFEKLEKSFGKIREKKLEKEKLRKENISEFKIYARENIIKRDCQQVHLCFNSMGVSYVDENKYAMSLLSNIFGESMSSRLFQKVREDLGLAYSIYSYLTSFMEGGLFTVYAGTSKENYKKVIELIKEEIELLKKDGVTERELERAKNQFKSSVIFSMENSRGKMMRLWNSYFLYGKIISVEEIEKKVSAISAEDIKKIANKLFVPENYSITILGEV
ncbi:MAG: M16 family metallopeptidase [Fusobacteriaceae bacterium]